MCMRQRTTWRVNGEAGSDSADRVGTMLTDYWSSAITRMPSYLSRINHPC